MKQVLIIHGEKPHVDCQMHPAFAKRLDKAVKLSSSNSFDMIIITGGKTRASCASEARAGFNYLPDRLLPAYTRRKISYHY